MPEPFERVTGSILVLPWDDVDTDQIIPARFLTTTDRDGLGRHAFDGWRGTPRARPLEDPRARDCAVLVAGSNFGCGSSREHAVWALQGLGLRAVIARSFADIFRGNALKNGLLPVEVDDEAHRVLIASPWQTVTVDLSEDTLVLPDNQRIRFAVEPFARRCLLAGIDQLDFLLQQDAAILAYEQSGGGRDQKI